MTPARMTPAQWRLGALVAVALALWAWRATNDGDGGVVQAASRASRDATVAAPRTRVPEPGLDDLCIVPAALPQRTPFAALVTGSPFSEPPPPPARRVARVELPPPPVAIEPPPPPPLKLPYRFYGVYNEPGKPAMVFLGLGGALLHARAGDTLEGGFRLESIGRRELSFVHLQQNVTLRMPIDGDPS